MIDTILLYILILVNLTLNLIESHRGANNQKHLRQLSHKVSIDLNGNRCTVVTCWCDEPHTLFFYLGHSVFKGENLTPMISLKRLKSNIGLYSDSYRPI